MQSLSRAFSTGELNHFSPQTRSQIQILYSFKKVNASSGAYPKNISERHFKKIHPANRSTMVVSEVSYN